MISNWIKDKIDDSHLSRAEVGRAIGMEPATFTVRLTRGYNAWTIDELRSMEVQMLMRGVKLDFQGAYDRVLKDTDRFEDLLEYVPLTRTQIAYMCDMNPESFYKLIERGILDIETMQKVKKIIGDTTPLKVSDSYFK